jgi:hypothetical protein
MASKTADPGDGVPDCFFERRWNLQHLTGATVKFRQELALQMALFSQRLQWHASVDSVEEYTVFKSRTLAFESRSQLMAGNQQFKGLAASEHMNAHKGGRDNGRVNPVASKRVGAVERLQTLAIYAHETTIGPDLSNGPTRFPAPYDVPIC